MVSIPVSLLTITLLLWTAYKALQRKSEWIVLLLITSCSITSLVTLFLGQGTYTLFWIGTIQFHVNDLVLIFLFVYCCLWIVKSPRITISLVLFFVMILLPLVISIVRGLFAGTFPSSNFIADTRTYTYFVLPFFTLYIMTKDKKSTDFSRSIVYFHQFMNCLAMYLVVIWILDLVFGINNLPGQQNGLLSDGGSTFRIVPKSVAALIALYVFSLAYNDFRKGDSLRWRTIFFALLVILIQLRVVQYAFLLGCFLLLLHKAISDRRISGRLTIQMSCMLFIFIAVPILFGRTALLASLIASVFSRNETAALSSQISSSTIDAMASFTSVVKNTGTFASRTNAWKMILGSLSGIDLILGQPFGTPYAQSVAWIHSPHSQYVNVIFKEGYAGLLCFVTFLVGMIATAVRRRQWLVAVCVVFFMVYFYAAGAVILSGAALGVCLGVLEWPRRDDLLNEESYGNY